MSESSPLPAPWDTLAPKLVGLSPSPCALLFGREDRLSFAVFRTQLSRVRKLQRMQKQESVKPCVQRRASRRSTLLGPCSRPNGSANVSALGFISNGIACPSKSSPCPMARRQGDSSRSQGVSGDFRSGTKAPAQRIEDQASSVLLGAFSSVALPAIRMHCRNSRSPSPLPPLPVER